MSNPSSLLGPTRDRTARGQLAVHDHVCGVYTTPEQQFEPACRFLQVGLERNEQCLYIAEHLTPAEFIRYLEDSGVNTTEAAKNNSLLVLSGEEVRRSLGGFTRAGMLSFLDEREKTARENGFTAFRLCADMKWLRTDNIEPAELFLYEAELNSLLQEREIVGLCQYAMTDYKSEFLIAAAETHPLLVYDDVVCDNFYFIPPEEFLKPRFADMKLKRMIHNIVTRERLMQKFLAD